MLFNNSAMYMTLSVGQDDLKKKLKLSLQDNKELLRFA